MLTLRASLKSAKSSKDVSDDIVQTVTFTVYGTAAEMGQLNELYRKPLEITIKNVE